MTGRKMIIASLAAAIAIVGAIGTAEAGRRGGGFKGGAFKMGFKHKHFRHRHFGPRVIVGFGDGGCGYFYRKWKVTGSFYWRNRYYECIY